MIWQLIGYGLAGSALFYVGSLLLGGSSDAAFTSSAIGFWLAVAFGFLSNRRT